MIVSLIAAVAESCVIGRDGRLPWRLAADLQRFKKLTMGHHLVLGRRTYESLDSSLPGRSIVVVSRSLDLAPPGARLAGSLAEALAIAAAARDHEVFVGGGGEIYRLALPVAERLYLTRVHVAVSGDTLFPDIDWSGWRLLSSEQYEPDAGNQYPYSFQLYERIRSPVLRRAGVGTGAGSGYVPGRRG